MAALHGAVEEAWLTWPARASRQKHDWPRINADKRGLRRIVLPAFIGVHQRPKMRSSEAGAFARKRRTTQRDPAYLSAFDIRMKWHGMVVGVVAGNGAVPVST